MCHEYEWYELERAAERERRKQRADELKEKPSKAPAQPAERDRSVKEKEPLPV
jgi:hypothetical protein